MSKNILIFSDGTGQAGGLKPDQILSNVYKLYRATRTGPDSPIDPSTQIAYYDPGLGTDPDSSRLPLRPLRWVRKVFSAATGVGITSNIVECYLAILKHYEPGDRIYLFGFSRGAYTARCVAGVLRLCGVPTQDGRGNPLPLSGRRLKTIASEAVRSVYEHGAGHPRGAFSEEREEKARRFRNKFASGSDQEADVVPYFIGVFDTVAALGSRGLRRGLMLAFLVSALVVLPAATVTRIFGFDAALWYAVTLSVLAGSWHLFTRARVIRDFPEKGRSRWHLSGWKADCYDLHLDPRVRYARHALAIDERRKDFARVGWGTRGHKGPPREGNEPEWFQQIWFAGCHSDIGGGYPEEESRLSDIALDWMVGEITSLRDPVHIDRGRLHLFPSPNGVQHCEVEGLLDMYPVWWPKAWRLGWACKDRRYAMGAPLHPSVLKRFEAAQVQQCERRGPYRPEVLREDPRVRHLYPDSPPIDHQP